MITVELGAATLATTRWALSPVADLMGLLRDERQSAVPSGTGSRTTGTGLLSDPLVALVAELTPPRGGYQPDFLTPKPAPRASAPVVFRDQLDQIAGTAPEVVEAQLVDRYAGRRVPEALRHQLRQRRLAPMLARGLARAWRLAGADAWKQALPRLRADLDERARQVGRFGLIATLGSLAPEITVDGLQLSISLDPWSEHALLAEDELVLVPRAFGLDRVSPQLCNGGDAVLYYSAGQRCQPEPQAGAELIGGTRQLVLAALDRPGSTKALSERLGFAAATISYHLNVLHRNGLVSRRRQGLEVLYQQTARGRDLVGAEVDLPAHR